MNGTVVQLVRAPPCHGGRCEFKSRRSRLFKYHSIIEFNQLKKFLNKRLSKGLFI